jgi:hypothetical protein
MQIHKIHDNTNKYVIDLMAETFSRDPNPTVALNYHPDHANSPANIFYILADPHGRYKRGAYYVLEEDGKYICSAGWNEYEEQPNTAIVLSRMYVVPHHRAKYYCGNHILPILVESTVHRYATVWATFNEHNIAIYNWFCRAHEGKRGGLFNNYPPLYRKFIPVGQKTIYNTKQYVVEYTH